MNKPKKFVILLFAIFSTLFFLTITISYSSFLINNSKTSSDIQVNEVYDNPVCYNGSTNVQYMDIQKALNDAKENDYVYVYIGAIINETNDIIIEVFAIKVILLIENYKTNIIFG